MYEMRQLDQTNYEDISALSQFAFQYELTEKEFYEKKEQIYNQKIWAYMDGETIAAKLHLLPLRAYINGKAFSVGGISSVATWPEYRRQGLVKKLLFHALKQMKDAGQTVSYLHPFSFQFYRKFGWEYVFNLKTYVAPMEKLAGNWQGDGYVRRSAFDYPVLNEIYEDYAKTFTGTLLRDETWWRQRAFKQMDHIAIAYNEDHVPEAYVHYKVKDDILSIHDIAYRNKNGLHLIMEFIGNHDSMVETVKMNVPENDPLPEIVYEPTFSQEIKPFFMARIVDVLPFLKEFPFQSIITPSTISIAIEDSFFTENSGVYYLRHDGSSVEVTFVKSMEVENKEQVDIKCTIQQLTQLFMGYKDPLHLAQIGLIEGKRAQLEKLAEWIPNQQTYYPNADFF